MYIKPNTRFPENTILMGNTVGINVGGPSPRWIQFLTQTQIGINLVIGYLRRLAR